MKTFFTRNEFSEMNMLHLMIEDLPINITDPLYYTYLVDANASNSNPDECVRLLSQVINMFYFKIVFPKKYHS